MTFFDFADKHVDTVAAVAIIGMFCVASMAWAFAEAWKRRR